jgi:hypothetical protein
LDRRRKVLENPHIQVKMDLMEPSYEMDQMEPSWKNKDGSDGAVL